MTTETSDNTPERAASKPALSSTDDSVPATTPTTTEVTEAPEDTTETSTDETTETPTADGETSESEPSESNDTPPDQAASDGETGEEPESAEPQKKSRAQERIDAITAQKRDAEAKLAAALRENARLRQAEENEAEIDEDDWEGNQQKLVRDALREEKAADNEAALNDAADAAAAARREVFAAKMDAVRDQMPNLDQDMANFQQVPVSHFGAEFIAESDRSVELAVHLGRNPALAHKIAGLPDAQQGVELARLEARLSAAPKSRKTTNAPSPPKTINGAASPNSVDPNNMTTEQYRKWRNNGAGASP